MRSSFHGFEVSIVNVLTIHCKFEENSFHNELDSSCSSSNVDGREFLLVLLEKAFGDDDFAVEGCCVDEFGFKGGQFPQA